MAVLMMVLSLSAGLNWPTSTSVMPENTVTWLQLTIVGTKGVPFKLSCTISSTTNSNVYIINLMFVSAFRCVRIVCQGATALTFQRHTFPPPFPSFLWQKRKGVQSYECDTEVRCIHKFGSFVVCRKTRGSRYLFAQCDMPIVSTVL